MANWIKYAGLRIDLDTVAAIHVIDDGDRKCNNNEGKGKMIQFFPNTDAKYHYLTFDTEEECMAVANWIDDQLEVTKISFKKPSPELIVEVKKYEATVTK